MTDPHRLFLPVLCAALLSATARAADSDEAGAEQPAPVVSLQAAYAGDFWQVPTGGLESGGAYLDDLDVQLAVDLEQAIGWQGAQFFFYAIYNDGNELSGDKIGDLNGVSNIETGLEALRVQEAWIDQTFADGRLSLRGGMYDLNSEFDAGEVRALFLGSSHGMGTEFGQTGLNGPSVFPVTSLGARLNWSFGEGAYARVAVLDGVLLAGRRELFAAVPFDAGTFDGFHLYDVDWSARAAAAGFRLAAAGDLLLVHHSRGRYDERWRTYADRFCAKHALAGIPPSAQRTFFEAAFNTADEVRAFYARLAGLSG